MWLRRLIAPVLMTALSCGCASSARHLSAVAAYDRGQPQEALQELNAAAAERGAEREILQVDEAICQLMAGDTRQAEHTLYAVRQQLEFLSQKDISERATSYLTDEQAIAWTGREFERRMLDCLMMLASLAGDRQDAFAFATRTSERLQANWQQLTKADGDNTVPPAQTVAHSSTDDSIHVVPVAHTSDEQGSPDRRPAVPEEFGTNALAAFLIAAVHSELPMNGDTMREALQQVGDWQPAAAAGIPDLQIGMHTPADHGTLHIVTLVGRVTDWQAESVVPSSAALLLADQILSANSDHTLPPTIAPVRIGRPRLDCSHHPGATTVSIAGRDSFGPVTSRTLIDLNHIAAQSYLASHDRVVAKAITRRIVKKGVVYATKNQLDVDRDSNADLLLSLGGAAWEALEKPDVRHARLLPERIEVAMITLPVGSYDVTLGTSEPDAAMANMPSLRPKQKGPKQNGPKQNGPPGLAERTTDVTIVNGRNTFVLCFRPQDHISHVVGGR